MAALRQNSIRRSELGDSWVVNDSDGEESGLEEDASLPPDQPVTRRSNRSQTPSISAQSAHRRRSSRAASAVPEPELIMPSIHERQIEESWTSANVGSKAGASPKKRTSKTSISSSSFRSRPDRRSSATTAGRKPYSSEHDKENTADKVLSLLGYSADWALDVIVGALRALRKPISWVVALYLFAGLLVMVQNLLFRSIYSALTPVCRIPGMSMLDLPICRTPLPQGYEDSPGAPVEFEQVMNVQCQFEELLDQSTAAISLPSDMKRSESSIRDVRVMVRYSHLRSKQEMMLELDGFIETARTASYSLQRFNSHVGHRADIVLSTARWTQRILDDIDIKKSNRGLLPAFVHDKFLAPFQPLKYTESTLLKQYIIHTKLVSEQIKTLIAEGKDLLSVLQDLEDRLENIQEVASKDDIHAQGQKDEVLSQIWTFLGGNRAKLGEYDAQMKLLRQVGEYRKLAWAHVSRAVLRLQAMSAELEGLQERVGSAERLKDSKEMPLAVHLESIRLGIERLEKGREASKQLEKERLDRALGREGNNKEIREIEG